MIKLTKSRKPQVLADNGDQWTKVIVEKIAAGEKPTQAEATRYRNIEIKEALVKETYNKCAYCESKLRHIHHGDVEHIMPKSLDPSLILQWDNLTLACEKCNQRKSDLDPNANEIIDPYKVDPRQHLVFSGPFIFALGSSTGISTRTIIGLDRADLIEARRERLRTVMGIYAEVLRADIPLHARRIIYRDLLSTEASPDTAYSAMTLDLIEAMKARIPDEVIT